MKRNLLFLLLGAGALLLLSGCAVKEPLPAEQAGKSSHINVPFVAPRSDRCASTALEMVSKYWESTASYHPLLSPKELDERTLIPAKEGTLQVELVAAARADGLLAYPLSPSFSAMLKELNAGNPVIVLVNRGTSWYPLWHYVTVTGYDATHEKMLAHFSDIPDEGIALPTFTAIWNRSGKWGIVPVPPDRIPASAQRSVWLRAAYDLETTGKPKEALIAYETGVKQWPDDAALRFALANAQYHAGRMAEAERSYRKVLEMEPSHPYALNNLADLMCRKGRAKEALKLLERDIAGDEPIRSLIETTRKEIRSGCPPRP